MPTSVASPTRSPITRADTTIAYDPKSISIATFTCSSTSSSSNLPPLIFTHGASGSMDTPAVANFRDGFTGQGRSCVVFQGNMNLGSRVKMFQTVVEHVSSVTENAELRPAGLVLGGRSMGARAAVIASTELHQQRINDGEMKNEEDGAGTSLILASYPLHDAKDQIRSQILFDLPPSTTVLFISGSKDSMCSLPRLQRVREEMQCKSWLVVAEGASHGMDMKPSKATAEVGRMTGHVAAEWLEMESGKEEGKREGKIFWDGEAARFGGWGEKVELIELEVTDGDTEEDGEPADKRTKPARKEEPTRQNAKRKRTSTKTEQRDISETEEADNPDRKTQASAKKTPTRAKPPTPKDTAKRKRTSTKPEQETSAKAEKEVDNTSPAAPEKTRKPSKTQKAIPKKTKSIERRKVASSKTGPDANAMDSNEQEGEAAQAHTTPAPRNPTKSQGPRAKPSVSEVVEEEGEEEEEQEVGEAESTTKLKTPRGRKSKVTSSSRSRIDAGRDGPMPVSRRTRSSGGF